jgi:hypothetical protein
MLRRSSTCALVHSTWIGSFNVAMSDSTHQISMNHFTWGALGNITTNGIYNQNDSYMTLWDTCSGSLSPKSGLTTGGGRLKPTRFRK